MAVDERERNALHNRLTEVLGEDAAVPLMRHLPPTGWGDVATKQDVHAIQFAELEGEIAGVDSKITGSKPRSPGSKARSPRSTARSPG